MARDRAGSAREDVRAEGATGSATGASRERRVLDRCGICGQFIGFYPVNFYCDHHCWRCICSRCPGVDGPGIYTARLEAA